jgi:hypothetical protein
LDDTVEADEFGDKRFHGVSCMRGSDVYAG